MSFSFFKQATKPKSPAELVKHTRDALVALDDKLVERVPEEVEKNLVIIKQMLRGDGEMEPNGELVLEICKDDFLEILVQKLESLPWEARKDIVHIWSELMNNKQYVVEYIENHTDILEVLMLCYESKETALNCGSMLRECARHPTLAMHMLESPCFQRFFNYVESPRFDIASDAFFTFKELLTRHGDLVCHYLTLYYAQFFSSYDKLLRSENYVTRRQSLKLLNEFLMDRSNSSIMLHYISDKSNLQAIMKLLKDPSKTIQLLAFQIFKVFVMNPDKSMGVMNTLRKNREKLLNFFDTFHIEKDEQLEEEKEVVTDVIEGLPISY